MFSIVTRDRKTLSGGLSRKHRSLGQPGPKRYTGVNSLEALRGLLPSLLQKEFEGQIVAVLYDGYAWRPSALAKELGLCG